MKTFLNLFLTLFMSTALAADVKISSLPLGTAATTGVNDSFPYVSAGLNLTRRLTLWDLTNLPTMVAAYAPKANPTFTGVVTAPSFVGALTGNASTATALASNPTDCSAGQYANAIAANGNLTCAAVSSSQISGTVGVANGGTGLTSGTGGGILGFTGSGTIASSGLLAANQLIVGGGAIATPATLTAGSQYQVLVMGASNPGYGQVALNQSAAITGTLPVGNGGTGLTGGTSGGIPYYSGASTIASSAALAAGQVVLGGGAGVTPATLAAGTSGQYIKSNGASAASWASFANPTIQKFITGTAQTYNRPAGVLYLRVKMVGGGGGGSGTSSGGSGGGGTASTFGAALLSASGGSGGTIASLGGGGGSGSSVTAPAIEVVNVEGGSGGPAMLQATTANLLSSGMGSASFLGGAGGGVISGNAGRPAAANSGSGGSGAGTTVVGTYTGSGGGAGAYIEAIIPSPSSTYTYTVGASGAAGAIGAGTAAGGAGGSGVIIVEEYYQ